MFIDEAAEYRLLASFVDQPVYLLKVTKSLFTGDRQLLYDAMRASYNRYGEVSSEGVERFYGRPVPAQIEMARGSKPAAIIDALVDLATKRQLAELQTNLTYLLASNTFDRKEINDALRLPPVVYTEDSSISPGIDRFVALLQQKRSGNYQFCSTGLDFMDHVLGGEWPRQGLAVIAAKSGVGKTALVCQSSLNMARKGFPVYIASLEMPRDKLVSRYIANMANIDGNTLKLGQLTKEEEVRANDALLELHTLPIYIEDDPTLSVEQIVFSIKNHVQTKNVKAFFVDYLQIVGNTDFTNNDKNMANYLGYVTQHLRNVAVQEDISGVALSQLNRGFKGLEGLLGSGRIGNIADVVVNIDSPEQTANPERRDLIFDFLKNRDGMIGAFGPILYRPKFLRFE